MGRRGHIEWHFGRFVGVFRRVNPTLSRIWAVLEQSGAVEEGHTPGPSTVVNLGMLFWRLDCFLCTTPHFQANNHLLDSVTHSNSPSGNQSTTSKLFLFPYRKGWED